MTGQPVLLSVKIHRTFLLYFFGNICFSSTLIVNNFSRNDSGFLLKVLFEELYNINICLDFLFELHFRAILGFPVIESPQVMWLLSFGELLCDSATSVYVVWIWIVLAKTYRIHWLETIFYFWSDNAQHQLMLSPLWSVHSGQYPWNVLPHNRPSVKPLSKLE